MSIRNAGEELSKRAREILKNPPPFDDKFQRINGPITFSEALRFACAENPEVAREYAEELRGGGPTFAEGDMKTLVEALMSLSQAIPKGDNKRSGLTGLEIIKKALENNPKILKRLTGKTEEELGPDLVTLAGTINLFGMMAEKVLDKNADLTLPEAFTRVLKDDSSLIRKLKAEYKRGIFSESENTFYEY